MPDTEKWFRITFLIVTENSYHDKALFHTFEFHTLDGKALFQWELWQTFPNSDVPKFWLFPGQIDLLGVITMFKLFSKSNLVGMLPGSY